MYPQRALSPGSSIKTYTNTYRIYTKYQAAAGPARPKPRAALVHIPYTCINFDNVVKVKLNLTFSSGTQDIGGWHYDYDKTTNIKIAVLYLNTNNGYTKLNDGTQILSEKNKLAVFDNVNHTDVTQTDTTERFVLNIGYIDD
mgnify:CR=1 FL=1